MTMTTRSIAERLAGCALVRTRLRGRAALTREAATDLGALRRLEQALGLPSPALPLAQEQWLARPDGRALGRQIAASGRGGVLAALVRADLQVRAITRLRATDREGIPAPVAGRIGAIQAERRRLAAQEIVLPIVARARLRTATHSHVEGVVLCAPGEERANSTSGWAWATDVGLPRAYCRQARRVATSTHTWCVSDPAAVRVIDRHVYLSATRRVRQGRGTSLVTESLGAGSRGPIWGAL